MPLTAPGLPLKITILGSGHVATHLSLAFEKAGHEVIMVYSRSLTNGQALAVKLKKATAVTSTDFTALPTGHVFFLCVTDSALPEVLAQAKFPAGSIVVHTSGSLPLSVLENQAGIHTGVFYPIQTFSKDQAVNLTKTPIAVEAEMPEVDVCLKNLAASVSQQVVSLSSPDRKTLHLAAVFACNFTNHLLGISQEILMRKALSPDLLHALVQTTLQKALNNNPFTVQTGPAVRGDANIMQQQIQQLELEPIYQEIYEAISHSIQEKAFSREDPKPKTKF